MVLLFLGISGSGKDTQAELLAERFGFRIVSTGQLVRQEITQGTEVGLQIKQSIEAGHWAPDAVIGDLIRQDLAKSGANNVVFTGAVRTFPQVQMLDQALSHVGAALHKVVLFELSEDVAIQRMSNRWFCPTDGTVYNLVTNPPLVAGKCDGCGGDLLQRKDDQPEAIRSRFSEFNADIATILTAYEQRELLLRLSAEPSIELIHQDLIQKLALKK